MLDIEEDFYGVLGVEETAAPDEIRKAYLKLAKKLHPDRFPNDPEKRAEAQVEFSKVTRAHEVLSDAKQKDEYDALRRLARNKGIAAVAEAPAEKAEVKAENRDSWAAKHCDRANDMLSRKRFPEAETAIKEAIRLAPNNAKYHAVLAEIQMARGWRTLAMTSVNAALKIDPKNYEAKQVELKLKTSNKSSGTQPKEAAAPAANGEKKGFLDQLKELLNKKM